MPVLKYTRNLRSGMANNSYEPVYRFLSLATKAGKIKSGEFSVEKAIKEYEAYLVIIAEDASDNTKKHFSDMCSYRDIPIRQFGDSSLIGKFTGKEFRKSIAVCDEGFSVKLQEMIDAVRASEI